MRKSTWLLWAVLLAILVGGAERSRYSPTYWRKVTGGIQYTSGGVNITNGIIGQGTDVYAVTKTVIKTIDLDDDTSTDDFQFDDDAANSTAQNKDLGVLIPAWAEIVSCHIRCFETVGANTFQVKLGTSSGGVDLLAQAYVDAENEIITFGTGGSPVAIVTASARNIWMEGDPTGNWSDAGDAGRWVVVITYRDYGAVFTAKNP